tara:strand:- start:6081 stop:6944 length:864 start_codon:yes stop_codon:yes gene_type:complete
MSKYSIISPTKHGWHYGYGFFSNYRICLEELISHHESGNEEIPYISWANTTWVESINPFEDKVAPSDTNPFDLWFNQPSISSEDTSTLNKYPPSRYGTLIDHAQHYFDNPTELKRQQTIDNLYIKPKQYILDKINKIYKDEFEGHIVLGLMARGTEYNLHHPMYGVFGVQDYINEVKKILEENKEITKIFIVSEDMEYIVAISKAFPESYFMPDVFRRTDETMEYINRVHCWPNVSTKREYHCRLLGEEVIIQAKLMGKCDYLFGRLSGMLAGGVLWSENVKKVYKI